MHEDTTPVPVPRYVLDRLIAIAERMKPLDMSIIGAAKQAVYEEEMRDLMAWEATMKHAE